MQGFLTGIVALLRYGRMVSMLGATKGAAFLALTHAMTALMGIPIHQRVALGARLDRGRPGLRRRVRS